MKDLKTILTESKNSTYVVIHSISGENPEVQRNLTYDKLTDIDWVTKNLFGGNDLSAESFVEAVSKPEFKNNSIAVLEGDAGFVTVVGENKIIEL